MNDFACHFFRPEFPAEIDCSAVVVDGTPDRCLNGSRFFFEAKRIAKEEGGAENGSHRIRNSFAGNVGC